MIDRKWLIGTFITVFLIGTGVVSAYFKDQDARAGANENKYATKTEVAGLLQYLRFMKETQDEANKEFKKGVDQANDRLYDIQKNQVLVKVANDNVVKVQRNLAIANSRLANADRKVSALKEDVQEQKVLVQEALGDKKKKKK
jgi:hypothetical protein